LSSILANHFNELNQSYILFKAKSILFLHVYLHLYPAAVKASAFDHR